MNIVKITQLCCVNCMTSLAKKLLKYTRPNMACARGLEEVTVLVMYGGSFDFPAVKLESPTERSK